MTRVLHELERSEQRVLGAVEFVDATSGARIREGLRMQQAVGNAGRARIVRNRSGLHVVWSLADLAAHAGAFLAPPASPALGSVELPLQVSDPAGQYLARSFSLQLPRDADPRHANNTDSLFRPQRVELYRSAAAPVGANWARLDVRVTEAASGDALGGTLVEVRDTSDRVLARGLTDWRGEAVVPVAGVPVTTWSDDGGAVVVSETAATVHALHVSALGSRTPAADVHAGKLPRTLPCPDPDAFAAHPQRRSATPQTIALAARRSRAVALSITLP